MGVGNQYAGTKVQDAKRLCQEVVDNDDDESGWFGNLPIVEGRWALGLANANVFCSDRLRMNGGNTVQHKIGYRKLMLMVGGKGVPNQYVSKDQVFMFCAGKGKKCHCHPFESARGKGGVAKCSFTNIKDTKTILVAQEVLQNANVDDWKWVRSFASNFHVKLLDEWGDDAFISTLVRAHPCNGLTKVCGYHVLANEI